MHFLSVVVKKSLQFIDLLCLNLRVTKETISLQGVCYLLKCVARHSHIKLLYKVYCFFFIILLFVDCTSS